jgi:hypothetical protein
MLDRAQQEPSKTLEYTGNTSHNIREFAMQPFEPPDGCLALRKLMVNGSNGFDTCPYFWSH